MGVQTYSDFARDANRAMNVNPGALDSASDSVDVAQKSKGSVVTAHNAITAPATSAAIDCTGYNAVLVDVNVTAFSSGSITVLVQGAVDGSGAYGKCYGYSGSGTTSELSAAFSTVVRRVHTFWCVPDSIKIDVSGTFTGTLTVKVQPFIL